MACTISAASDEYNARVSLQRLNAIRYSSKREASRLNQDQTLEKLGEIMREWAYGNTSSDEAAAWRAHITDLERLEQTDALRAMIAALREFASRYSKWS